jgi:hypothetical protein
MMDIRFYGDGFWIIWSSQIMTDERKFLRRSEARR